MLKYTILIILFSPLIAVGQTSDISDKIYYGPNVSLGYSYYSDQGGLGFEPMLEIGGFINSKVTKSVSVNFSLNLSLFPEHSHEYNDFYLYENTQFPFDSVQTGITGVFQQEVAMISLPLRVELSLSKNKRIGILAGLIPRFRLYDKASWEYTYIGKNIYTGNVTFQSNLVKEKPDLRFFKLDGLQIGLFYKINKWKLSALATNSGFLFENARAVKERHRIDFQLELSYQIN